MQRHFARGYTTRDGSRNTRSLWACRLLSWVVLRMDADWADMGNLTSSSRDYILCTACSVLTVEWRRRRRVRCAYKRTDTKRQHLAI